MIPISSHSILTGNSAKSADLPVCSLIALNTNASDRKKICKSLPDFSIKTCFPYLINKDCIDFPEGIQSFLCHLSDASNTKPWAGEWMTINKLIWKTKLLAKRSYFILEKLFQRFKNLPFEIFRKASYIVVRLNFFQSCMHLR